jgi:hypothetical protein
MVSCIRKTSQDSICFVSNLKDSLLSWSSSSFSFHDDSGFFWSFRVCSSSGTSTKHDSLGLKHVFKLFLLVFIQVFQDDNDVLWSLVGYLSNDFAEEGKFIY